MNSRIATSAAALAFACAACGLMPVELDTAPDRQAIVNGNVPRSAIERLAADDAQASGPMQLTFVYPSDGVALPDGVAPIAFEWRSMPGPDPKAPKPAADKPMANGMPAAPAMPNDMAPAAAMMGMAGAPMPAPKPAGSADHVVYELRCLGVDVDLRLYTDATSASYPSERWHALLHAHAGESLRVELRALQVDGKITRAPALNLGLRAGVVAGSLYAWSTSAQGIVVAGLQATQANYLAPPPAAPGDPVGGCLGCHSVSRDGHRVLAAVGGSPRMISWQPATAAAGLSFAGPPMPLNKYVFGTFDPTAARIAIAYAGSLRLYNADTGELLREASWPGLVVDHPDWSPDGRFIAVSTSAPGPDPDKAPKSSGIARIKVELDGTLASPESVLMGMLPKDGLRRYPAYSPDDGDWIAFEQRKGPDDSMDSSLWIVAADGGEPIQLQRLATDPKQGAALDGMPSWLPTDVPGQAWLVFSAERPIGSFVPAAGQRQLFLSALDLPLAAAGSDPSSPAFWLPFQERTSSYRRAQWAKAVGVCSAALKRCNGQDDDCDGRADESCCTPAPETCGDGLDNDCDGQSDEGCGCAFREVCGDGLDNDCDLSVDELPCAASGMPGAR